MADTRTRCPACARDFEGCTCTSEQHRRDVLAAAIHGSTGPWTSRRAHRLYRTAGIAPGRRTARRDLAALARRGVLARHEQPGFRHYTRKDTR